jgi:nitrogen-specific signal transduction histidine kinase
MVNKPVLFAVDDDPEVLRAVERNLRRKYARGRDGDDYRVLIANSAGSAMNTQSRVFEPYFTTKGVGEGTSLGLDIIRRIVAGHGGEIRVDSTPGETSFKVRLPIDGPRRGQDDEDNEDGG